MKRSYWMAMLAVLSCMVVPALALGQRVSEGRDKGKRITLRETKQVISQTQERIAVGYGASFFLGREMKLSIRNQGVELFFDLPPGDTTTPIRPESFTGMRGTRRATAALATALGQMLADQGTDITVLNIKGGDPIYSSVEGYAVFEDDDQTSLLLVRFEDERPVLDWIPDVEYAGCSATVPGHTCSCNASGAGATCSSGTNSHTGTSWADCSDSSEDAKCKGKGGTCGCAVVAR